MMWQAMARTKLLPIVALAGLTTLSAPVGASDLPARVRNAGFDLAFRSGYLRAPPPETVFLHRKLVGSFLLCARIRARVDVQSLILPFLD